MLPPSECDGKHNFSLDGSILINSYQSATSGQSNLT